MPKSGKQWIALAVLGGTAWLGGNVAQNLTGQDEGAVGIGVGVLGAALGALLAKKALG